MIIDIIGTGLTAKSYDWERPTYKWSVSSYEAVYKDDVHLYFSMHEGQDLGLSNEITLQTYPLQAITEKYDTSYFTSSIAYMVAYALYTGAEAINIYGVDMEHDTEYKHQRPCLAYWVGYAKALGVKVNIETILNDQPYLYGYDTERMTKTLEVLESRKLACRKAAEESADKEREQWLGAWHAHNKIIELLRG